jgi:hypothetical protein
VRVSMTDRDVVERVGRLLDRAVVPLRARQAHHKPPFAVTIRGAPAVDVMLAALNHMGSKRQAEIQRAILSWHRHRSRHRRSPSACAVAGCALRSSKRGLCKRHYNSWWKAHRYGRESSITPIDPSSAIVVTAHTCDEICDFSWLVGLLEGEGTFTATRTQGHDYPVLKVEMCTEDVVTRAARLLGAASVSRIEPEQEGWNVSYLAAISGSTAAGWMRALRAHMGHRRGEAIDAALARYHPIRLVDPPESCVVPGCSEPHRGRGLCHKHYMMWSRDKTKGRAARIAPLR